MKIVNDCLNGNMQTMKSYMSNHNNSDINYILILRILARKVEKLVSLGATSTDTATEALMLYKKSERFFAESLRQTEHGQKTFELGFNSDIEKCAEIDKYKVFGVLSTNHNRPCIIPNQVRH